MRTPPPPFLPRVRRRLILALCWNRKLWLDLVYVSYDVFHLSPYKDVVQMLTGLGASGIRCVESFFFVTARGGTRRLTRRLACSVLNGVETQRLDALEKGL